MAASRLEAMALKRREYYFRTDRDCNYQIYEGIRAEARVVSVIRAGIFVDLFGAECYIPLRELSYQRWVDAASHYQPGQRVLVKVLDVDRSDRSKPRVAASVKQASENPYEKALKKYAVGNRYVGTVSMVDLSGVFVSLDGGIDCLCTHPKRGRPPRGARVTVRILGINNESNHIGGVITHMDAAIFAKMLSDKHFLDLKKMCHKYSPEAVREMSALVLDTMAQQLPLLDFSGKSAVYPAGSRAAERKRYPQAAGLARERRGVWAQSNGGGNPCNPKNRKYRILPRQHPPDPERSGAPQ